MEVAAWKRSDELVSILTNLSSHIQHGRGNDAIAVVKTIKKDGIQFREAVKTVTDCVNELFKQKRKEMEAMQGKRDDIKNKIPSLQSGMSTCKENITQHQNEVVASRRQESQADDTYQQADQHFADGKKRTGLRWWHIAVPVIGTIVGICNHASGKKQMARAEKRKTGAMREKEIAQQSIREAEKKMKLEESNIETIKNMVGECQSLVDELHSEVGILKDAAAFTVELNGVFEQVLDVTDAALGRTDKLKTMLDCFVVKTGLLLESRGTRALLRTVGERWMEVRNLVVTIPSDRNALIWQEAQRMTALSLGRQALKESSHLLWSLKTKLREGHASDAIFTLMEMQAKGAYFETLAEVEKEHLEEREKRAKEEMKRTGKRLSIETQLDSIGFDNNLVELRREYHQQEGALEELIKQKKCLEQCVESTETIRYNMGALRSSLKVCAWVPESIVRVFRSHSLLRDAGVIEDGWEALTVSYG